MFLVPDDLTPFSKIEPAKAMAMIEDAEAQAVLVAPCINDLAIDDPKRAAVKAILRRAVLRWNEAGTGALSSQQTGPYSVSVDTRQPSRGTFWPSEIDQLQKVCATSSGAFSIRPSGVSSNHLPWCSVYFGGTCSCGANIAGTPIYELGD